MAAISASSAWHEITSASNARLKLVKKIHARRQREKLGLVLLEGHRLVLDAFDAGLRPEFVVLHDGALSHPSGNRLEEALSSMDADNVLRAPEHLVASLSDTKTPQGVLAVFPQPQLDLPASPSLILVCDGISDPGNLGTLLRSAAGAGVSGAILTPGCSDPWGLKALRSGMGAQCRLPVRQLSWEETSAQLDAWGCAAYGADAAGSIAHYQVDWQSRAALIVGSEAHGLSDEVRADASVALCRIPLGSVTESDGEGLESLNAAVAGSIILFEAQRQRRLTQ